MLLAVAGFSLGLILCQQLAHLPIIYWVLLLFIFIPTLFLTQNRPVRLLAWASIGFLWSLFYAHMLLASQLKPSLEGIDLLISGTVSSIPHKNAHRTRFRFSVSTLLIDSTSKSFVGKIPKTLLLNWYKEAPRLRFGDPLRLRVRLKRAHGYMNPGGFDYESWIFRQRIDSVGYVKARLRLLPNRLPDNPSLNTFIGKARQNILEAQTKSLENQPFQGILTALAIGDRHGITDSQWQILTNTGTNHLMAISGLHIGLVSGLIFFLVRRLWGFFPYLVHQLAAPQAAAICSIISAVAYAALAGFSVPTQRALIMVSIIMLGLLLKRRVTASQTLLSALMFVLVFDPLAVLSAGFWLSFTAVGTIMYAMNHRVSDRGLWTTFGKVQVVALIGLAPLLAVFFQKISLISPIANSIAVPWVSMVTIPLTLLGSILVIPLPVLGDLLLMVAHYSLEFLWPLLAWLADLQLSTLSLTAPSLWGLGLAWVAVICLLAPSGLPSKWLGLIFFIPLLSTSGTVKSPHEGSAIFTMLDVGQGLSTVIQTSKHVLVYDTGPKYSSNFDTGKAVVLPYLQASGIDKINTLIISHGDNDHIGGADSLVEKIAIDHILTSVPNKIDAQNVSDCTINTQWVWDGVRFTILHPNLPAQLLSGAKGRQKPTLNWRSNSNNMSCVLRVETLSGKVLITGDIEHDVEKFLVAQSKRGLIDIRADVLVVPHHGSKTSSESSFIDAVKPKFALFAVGYRNRYGFPKRDIVERYLQRDIELFDTSQYGAITFTLGETTEVGLPDLYRHSVRRYWHTITLNESAYLAENILLK